MSSKVEVVVLPKCDFCSMQKVEKDAMFDGATSFGSWANMCMSHFAQYGIGLGTGRGQKLVLKKQQENTSCRFWWKRYGSNELTFQKPGGSDTEKENHGKT
jgi:hypothetical protein